MKRLIIFLFTLMAVCLLISGCQAIETGEATLTTSHPTKTNDGYVSLETNDTIGSSDQEVFLKLYHLIDISSKQSTPMKLEYVALVKNISISKPSIIISFDKIEPTNNEDPQGDFYTNAVEQIEEIELSNNIIILADPHNNFEAVTVDGLEEFLVDGDIPFYFYSINNDISVLIEMMLP